MSIVSLDYVHIEMKLDGVNWTDVTADVSGQDGINFSYGIPGFSPTDRSASTGRLSFALNNSQENSASTLGYYNPRHSSCRSGFALGCPTRVVISAGTYYGDGEYGDIHYGSPWYKFYGKITSITVDSASYGDRKSRVEVNDFVYEMGRQKIDLLDVQLSRRSDLLFGDIIGNMSLAPTNTDYNVGQETFTYAADDLKDERNTALGAAQKCVMSEFGYFYIRGGTDGGDRLVFEDRHHRVNTDPLYDISGSNTVYPATLFSIEDIYNRILTTSYPREIGESAETLFTLQNALSIPAGGTAILRGRYVDPDQRTDRIAGIGMITPVISTDYKFGTTEGPTVEDLNASLGISANYGGNEVEYTLINNAGGDGFVNLLRARGTAIRIYEPVTVISENAASQASYGVREYALSLPYQTDPLTSKDFGDVTVASYAQPIKQFDGVSIVAKSGTIINQIVSLEPGDRITLTNPDMGLADDFFIQSVTINVLPGSILKAIYGLRIATSELVWLLGQVDFGEIGVNTVLGA